MTDNYLKEFLDSYREEAPSKGDLRTLFKHLVMIFLTHDPVQSQSYTDVKLWRQWAGEHGWKQSDQGIDLVAKLKNENGYAAIQCKFYDPSRSICRGDIDSFISASGKEPFKRRVIIEMTEWTWSEPAEEMIRGQKIPVILIGLRQLSESPVPWEEYTDKGKIRFADKKCLREHQKPLREHQKPPREHQKPLREHQRQEWFRLLITVQGVGKKAALALLGTLSSKTLLYAILSQDQQTLSQVEGIGTKLAKRILLELKDKVESLRVYKTETPINEQIQVSESFSMAVSGLVHLGYSRSEAYAAVSAVEASTEGTTDPAVLIRASLQMLDKKESYTKPSKP